MHWLRTKTIKFGECLTVVYGQNAAGKSGYTRVLKKACRARGSEEILGNVLSEKAPSKPSASLKYKVGNVEKRWAWTDTKTHNKELGDVSVFDRHCATVYLSQKTDVAFRPFGLDLFDKLAGCCEKLRSTLEKERQELSKRSFDIYIPEATKAFEYVSNLTALTDLDKIREYANLSKEQSSRLDEAKRQLHEAKSEDRDKHAKALELTLKRIRTWRSNAENLISAFSDEQLTSLKDIQAAISAKNQLANQLTKEFNRQSQLEETGSDEWKKMWQSAERFSKVVYPGEPFPLVKKNSRCLLCQQKLDSEALERFSSFTKFMTSTVQKELDSTRSELGVRIEELNKLINLRLSDSDVLSEVELEDSALAAQLRTTTRKRETAVEKLVKELEDGKPVSIVKIDFDLAGLVELEQALKERHATLSKGVEKGELKKLQQEIDELEGRKLLNVNLPGIVNEIERQKQLAVYALCLRDVGTTAITKKSTEITKEVVTDHLIKSFQSELTKLDFDHVEIELEPSGASRGAQYHKLAIKRTTNIEVQSVVSEGEARALSIVAFFAELSTASNKSGILFDDPVSSLDHIWREKVAARLVEESQFRQVIVFTHDVVFLTTLSRIAGELKVDITHQYIHRERLGAGVSSQDLPWVAMKIKDRIGVLNKKWQEAEKIERTSSKEEYEKEAILIYGYLRETWERALEEVLVGGVIERYRPSIQTLKVKMLADITLEDCEVFDGGMTRCSRWLPGHDSAAAECFPVPKSSELKKDIETIEGWTKAIHRRRN